MGACPPWKMCWTQFKTIGHSLKNLGPSQKTLRPTWCPKLVVGLRMIVLQPLRWRCVDCVIHHERDVREEQKYICVARTSNNGVISSGNLYCCLLPWCEALRTCRSGFPIATRDMVIVIKEALGTIHYLQTFTC